MARIFIILFSLLLLACGDPVGHKNTLNQNLNAQIQARLNLLSTSGKQKGLYANLVHTEIQKLISPINLFDACRWEMAQANALFERQVKELSMEGSRFVRLDSQSTKAKVIVAIKQNELVLLDHLLSMKNTADK